MKRLIIRASLVIAWFGLGAVLFVGFRGHTLLVDNHDLAEAGVRAPDIITVSVDRGKGIEFFRGDRDRFILSGSRHVLRVEFSDGRPPFEAPFTLPLWDDVYLLSIPRALHGIEPAVEVFRAAQEARQTAEEPIDTGGDIP
jgi:hypothetical protein